MVENRVDQRAYDGFGMLPADNIQRAKGGCNVDGLMADRTKIATGVAGEDVQQLGA